MMKRAELLERCERAGLSEADIRYLAKIEPASMSVVSEIAAERWRQISQEGWSEDHDDQHTDGSLADAAAAYAATDASKGTKVWPKSWARHWWKPKRDRRRNLVIAGALIVAEIERLDRLAHADETGK